MSNNKKSKNPFDIFIIGARKGFAVGTNNLLPNVMMAYTLALILKLLGVLDMIGVVFGPVMAIFGLPGEAITVLLTSWLSSSAGVGIAVGLMNQGVLDGQGATILMPAIFLIGSQLQYLGRLLGVADVPVRYWPLLILLSVVNAVLSMLVMRFIV
ncbi:MAG: YjiG family protein [Veillonella sp.]|uniref:YjiG family protein n=1 Tax=Veillonella sp. TaxID=1926307 RepID=UPI0025DA9A9E|nr:YjiG family protein [Veillonella sp.]MBS4913774.1 YjiG family protein [Veillonella sp.]